METEGLESSDAKVDLTIENPPARWRPIAPRPDIEPPGKILFTDGVRRVDARVWVDVDEGRARPGIAASYAAGAVRCDGRASVVAASVERGLFSTAKEARAIECRHASYPVRRPEGDSTEELALALQKRMADLEVSLAAAEEADVIVIDGPLTGRRNLPSAVGYIKTHHVSYLPPEAEAVVAKLGQGERTPLFLIAGAWSKLSWYVRLPGEGGHSWSGVVRCETSGDAELPGAVELADTVTAFLPRFASAAHKDPRAPQNLYPIAGLERELKRRLGDPALLYRGLRVAAAKGATNRQAEPATHN